MNRTPLNAQASLPLPAKRKVQEAVADEILKAEVAKSGAEVARAYQVV